MTKTERMRLIEPRTLADTLALLRRQQRIPLESSATPEAPLGFYKSIDREDRQESSNGG